MIGSSDDETPLMASGGDRFSSSPATGHEIGSSDPSSFLKDDQPKSTMKRYQSLETVYPVSLSWSDVSVTVRVPDKKAWYTRTNRDEEKILLKKVSGVIKPGTLVALMGASGAGKSTLLNVLTSRNIKNYHIDGDIRIGLEIKNISAYVQQDDLFIPTLTVREQLQFKSLLRMDNRLDQRSRLLKVEEVIKEMGLTKCANNRIGDAGGGKRGISGGEKKRLSFASEALTNPPIFFCDEPTSGLDSFVSRSVVSTLQKMASKGRVILCTIHQPSSDLFAMFDHILLLSEGKTAFMGPQRQAIDFFEKHGYPCPENFNPADHYILTLAIIPGQEEECRRRTTEICDVFQETEEYRTMKQNVETLNANVTTNNIDPMMNEILSGESRYEVPCFTQLRYLFWRSWINMLRDTNLTRVRIIIILALALLLGLIYLRQTVDQKGVMSINGAIFLMIINTTFSTMYAVVNSFPIELGVFLREYGSGLYRVDTYYLTKTLSEIPLFLIMNAIYGTIIYWMIGLYDSMEAFFIAIGVVLLITNVSLSMGYLMSTLCGSVSVALAVAPPVIIPIMLFGGLFLNSEDYPVYFRWLEYISWFKYSNEILMINQWRYVQDIPCPDTNVTSQVLQTLFNPTVPTESPSQCLFRSGKDVLQYNSFSEENLVNDVIIMVALHLGFWLLSITALWIRAKRSKE